MRLDRARRAYLQADCHRIGKDLAIAEVDMAHPEKFDGGAGMLVVTVEMMLVKAVTILSAFLARTRK